MRDSQLIQRRLVTVGVCVLCLIGALALAWWQWQRYESASGTLQNLGYVLQWPLFGLFPAFVFWRMKKLRAQQQEEGSVERWAAPVHPDDAAPHRPAARPAPVFARVPVSQMDVEESEEDAELAAYNRYLAELNAKHQQEM